MKKIIILFFSLFAINLEAESLPLESAHILLSFPHSGNHACRFMIEYLSGLPTRGCCSIKSDSYICKKPFMDETLLAHVDELQDPCVYKEHWIKKIPHVCNTPQTLVIILRDYKEALSSWGRAQSKKKLSIKNFKWYMDIIQYYDDFEGKKMILYYKDLINNPAVWVENLYYFYEFTDAQRFEYLKNNAQEIMEESKKINYKKKKKNIYLGCYKNRSGTDMQYYQKNLLEKSLQEIHNVLDNDYDTLTDYIKDYK